MAIYLKITNPTEVVKKKTSKWLTDITPERIDRKLVEDEVIKGIIEQLTFEGIKGEISAINGFEVNESSVITTLTTTDQDSSDTHTYSLVSGD